MTIIAVINQKGGVAKTVTTSNLACALAKMGKNVLAVDLDPQGSLGIISGLYGEEGEGDIEYEHTTYEVLCKNSSISQAAIYVDYNTKGELYIVPSDISLENANLDLQSQPNPNTALKKALSREEVVSYFDYVLIDCPPALNRLSMNALYCADKVVIPCTPTLLAYKGLQRLFDTIEIVMEDNTELEIVGVISTITEAHLSKHQKYIEKMKNLQYPFIGAVPKRASADKTSDIGVPVVLAKAGSDIGREYYRIATLL